MVVDGFATQFKDTGILIAIGMRVADSCGLLLRIDRVDLVEQVMKWILALSGLSLLVFVQVGAGQANKDMPDRYRTGRLHRIDIKARHPRAYHPRIGDVMKCYLDFPIVPEMIADGVETKVDGQSVTLVGVVSTSEPRIVGSGQVSVYLVPRISGLTKVTFTPVIPGQKPESIEINFFVDGERER